jgi:hypothetical protein
LNKKFSNKLICILDDSFNENQANFFTKISVKKFANTDNINAAYNITSKLNSTLKPLKIIFKFSIFLFKTMLFIELVVIFNAITGINI